MLGAWVAVDRDQLTLTHLFGEVRKYINEEELFLECVAWLREIHAQVRAFYKAKVAFNFGPLRCNGFTDGHVSVHWARGNDVPITFKLQDVRHFEAQLVRAAKAWRESCALRDNALAGAAQVVS